MFTMNLQKEENPKVLILVTWLEGERRGELYEFFSFLNDFRINSDVTLDW